MPVTSDAMLTAHAFLDACHQGGFRFVSGTPCSYLKPLINAAIDDARFCFRDAVNEGDAVAMASGATLGGGRAMVFFQNSGLGNAVNALTSVCQPFRVPLLLIVTHRGEPGGAPDEPQHEQMGRITTALLDTLEIPWARFPETEAALAEIFPRIQAALDAGGRFALVMGKDAVAPCPLRKKAPAGAPGERSVAFTENLRLPTAERASRTEALQAIRSLRLPDEVLVATTGFTGRELYALGDDPWNLYLVGSMGSASAFGLGLALQQRSRPVTVIEGDGAVLMRMGNLASLGAYGTPRLRHIVLDNESHDSTGGQSTVSRGVSLASVALACGYRSVVSTDSLVEMERAILASREAGPAFIHFRIRGGAPDSLPRPKVPPHAVWERLQRWLQGGPK